MKKSFRIGPIAIDLAVSRHRAPAPRAPAIIRAGETYRLNIGPGGGWQKPDASWLTVDIDPARGDICANFNKGFTAFPLADGSVAAIYASHVFEHISVYAFPAVLRECHRILAPGGVLRIITPNPRVSMQRYLAGDATFPLFARRIARARKVYGEDYTLFDALREDFISRANQPGLLDDELAHQNAWDLDAMRTALVRAGFANVRESGFQKSTAPDFAFEGTYPSEANEADRSLYVEARK